MEVVLLDICEKLFSHFSCDPVGISLLAILKEHHKRDRLATCFFAVNDERHKGEIVLNAEMVRTHSQRERAEILLVQRFDIMFSLSQRNAHKAAESGAFESIVTTPSRTESESFAI